MLGGFGEADISMDTIDIFPMASNTNYNPIQHNCTQRPKKRLLSPKFSVRNSTSPLQPNNVNCSSSRQTQHPKFRISSTDPYVLSQKTTFK